MTIRANATCNKQPITDVYRDLFAALERSFFIGRT